MTSARRGARRSEPLLLLGAAGSGARSAAPRLRFCPRALPSHAALPAANAACTRRRRCTLLINSSPCAIVMTRRGQRLPRADGDSVARPPGGPQSEARRMQRIGQGPLDRQRLALQLRSDDLGRQQSPDQAARAEGKRTVDVVRHLADEGQAIGCDDAETDAASEVLGADLVRQENPAQAREVAFVALGAWRRIVIIDVEARADDAHAVD